MSEPSEIRATYLIETSDPDAALNAICRGQSVGNPTILTPYETKEFLNQWSATGKHYRRSDTLYLMVIRFPQKNFGAEGINYLLSVLLGGQCDIDVIQGCRLMELNLGFHTRNWPIPRYGLQGIREFLNVPYGPLICGILKPKIGLTSPQVADIVQQMIEGGCHVIKEDEILADQYWCPREERLRFVKPLLDGVPVLYLSCITSDGGNVWKAAKRITHHGPQFGVHANLWIGLGTFLELRHHVHCPIFFQKSGDKVWTTGPFAMEPSILYQFIHLIGCDFAHVGMYGGYLSESVGELRKRIEALQTTIPSFSCGMTPELAETIVHQFGSDVMLTSGGWIHAQSEGIAEAIKQLKRRAIKASQTFHV